MNYDRIRPLFKQGWIFAYIVVALLVTQLSLKANPLVGVYINAAALLALVGLALWKESARQLAISVTILPVATMVCLSLPPTTDSFNRLMIYYDVILLLALIYRYLFTLEYPLKLTKLGTKGYLLFIPAMLILGQLLGSLGYLMLHHQYPFSRHITLLFVFVAGIQFAFTEEIVFRGLIQQRAKLILHPATAAALATLTYAIFAIGLVSWLWVAFALISGAVYSTVYYFKQNLVLTFSVNALTKITYLTLLSLFVFR